MATSPHYPKAEHQASNNSIRPRRLVQFSPTSQLALYVKTEGATSWSTKDDHAHFKRELARDARRVGRLLVIQSPKDVSRDDIFNCVGIEHLISLDKAMRAMECRRNHIRRVIEAQDRCSDEELRLVSWNSSAPTRNRALKLAGGYWSMMDMKSR
eukprot:CAMPEP_0201614680 /NCGR_PEP_ID=MMETSP0492-20130828/29354_1 /ASSEMBLY_ACC=CAM_ASM_000837 /TAXON_ID=420259 /ORGANISM="Thalassiosira gravida, Strain GMp14c1" /LENGTH=154 /DNA_ID=CAMNT_0048082051 /DNA_START=63 /DNA_END=527 /DNA_ORIENTATION=-